MENEISFGELNFSPINTRSNTEYEENGDRLKELENLIIKASKAIKIKNEELMSKDEQLNRLKLENQQLFESIEELHAVIDSNEKSITNEETNNLNKELKELKTILSDKNKMILEYKCLILEIEREKKNEIEEKTEIYEKYQTEMEEISFHKDKIAENIFQAEETIVLLKNKNDELEEKILMLQRKNNKRKKMIKDFKKRNIDLQSDLKCFSEEKEMLLGRINESEEKIKLLKEDEKKNKDEIMRVNEMLKNNENIYLEESINFKNIISNLQNYRNYDEFHIKSCEKIMPDNLIKMVKLTEINGEKMKLNNLIKRLESDYIYFKECCKDGGIIFEEKDLEQKKEMLNNTMELMNFTFLENERLKERNSQLKLIIHEYQDFMRLYLKRNDNHQIKNHEYNNIFAFMKEINEYLINIRHNISPSMHNLLLIQEILQKKDFLINQLVLSNQDLLNSKEKDRLHGLELENKLDCFQKIIKKLINQNEILEKEKCELSSQSKRNMDNLKLLEIEYDNYRKIILKNHKNIDFPKQRQIKSENDENLNSLNIPFSKKVGYN